MFYCLLISLRLTFLYKKTKIEKQQLKMANTIKSYQNRVQHFEFSGNRAHFHLPLPLPPLPLYKYYNYIVSLSVFSFSTISIQPPTLSQHIASCIKRERAQPPVCSKYFLIVNNLAHRFFFDAFCVETLNTKQKKKEKIKKKEKHKQQKFNKTSADLI